jgi:mono/diheme cytochrome c family protein
VVRSTPETNVAPTHGVDNDPGDSPLARRVPASSEVALYVHVFGASMGAGGAGGQFPGLGPLRQRGYVHAVSPSRSFAFLAIAVVLLAACDSPPAASTLPEWTPSDHDRTEESARAAQQAGATPAANGGAARPQGPDPVLEAAWSEQCAACHGTMGRGDGPTGPMVHAKDLTSAEWQATVTDKQIAAAIMAGKGKMPSFANLPPKIIAGLVARIRATKGL